MGAWGTTDFPRWGNLIGKQMLHRGIGIWIESWIVLSAIQEQWQSLKARANLCLLCTAKLPVSHWFWKRVENSPIMDDFSAIYLNICHLTADRLVSVDWSVCDSFIVFCNKDNTYELVSGGRKIKLKRHALEKRHFSSWRNCRTIVTFNSTIDFGCKRTVQQIIFEEATLEGSNVPAWFVKHTRWR